MDLSDYRANTYGPPTHYCDCTRSLGNNGSGTLLDPWNLNQAKALAVAGNVVGFLPVGAGTPVQLAAPQSPNTPAFHPANSGTSNSNRIVFVTKYAASLLGFLFGKLTVGTNPNRTELRHAGAPATIDIFHNGGVNDTGGPIVGGNNRGFITFDGFYYDMAQCEIREDSGVIRSQDTSDIHHRNFIIKGKTVGVASNVVVFRPGNSTNDVLSNFYAWGFHNTATAGGNTSNVRQPALFSDQYGSQNFTIENFDIDDFDRGIFCKGSASFTLPNILNYGTIRYGRISNTSFPFAFNAMAPLPNITTVHHVLAYGTYEQITGVNGYTGIVQFAGEGIDFDTITPSQERNIEFDYCTIAKVVSASNTQAAFSIGSGGLAAVPNGVKLTNSILDVNNGANTFVIASPGVNDLEVINNNYYTKNGASIIFTRNGSTLTFAQWQSATGKDANSQAGNTSPFNNRSGNDYTINPAHPAFTMSTNLGQLGCYNGGLVVGVDGTSGDVVPPAAPTGVRVR